MKILAIQRLDSNSVDNEMLDKKLERLKKQKENLQKGMPSKKNKMKISPENLIQKRRQILDLQDKILDTKSEKMRRK